MNDFELLKSNIKELQGILDISRMPTIKEIREHRYLKLEPLINRFGGNKKVSKLLNLDLKIKTITLSEEDVVSMVMECSKSLCDGYMPSSVKALEYGGNVLHNNIVRKGGYKYFSELTGLKFKETKNSLGKDYEYFILEEIKNRGLEVKKMSSGHPYDILVNNAVKIDVKVGMVSYDRKGCSTNLFGLKKVDASCDIYVCVALDESESIDRIFVIPAHQVKIKTLGVGKDSKYNKYINKFEYIEQYAEFFNSVD